MKYTLPTFIRSQFTTLPPVNVPDLTGRVVIVTGSNIGLGYEAAKTFAKYNPARLILAVRNTKAGDKAAQEIVEANGGKGTVPEVWELDLGRLQSVKDFGERVNRELDRLDIFVSNAGIATEKFTRTADGFESTSQVNNIANSLLSVLLVPILRRTAHLPPPRPESPPMKPHLCIVASEVHHWINGLLPGMKEGRKDILKCFQEEELFVGSNRYSESKAVNVMNVFVLAELIGPDVVVNAINPGFCHSGLMRETVGIKGMLAALMKMVIARSTEVGSRNLVWAGTQDMPTGSYVHDCAISEPSDFVISPQGREIGKDIWEEMKAVWKEKLGVDADAIINSK
ncbi:hypothetical protein QFC22_006141 [Naganishia vaughanmartiniae]|uniref:Uncharacterized protein n=1 Tax=Naganishia vaughanmartiniae TaxID=1424756 RepID=A0ACC2WNY8_9TREE|nr:hypothetical protein QFC22_006141 [Naganishia vaughanmartiniae]